MGHTHALSGAVAGLAVVYFLGHSADAYTLAPMFAAVGAGAALMPDLDHPSSTAARSLGPLSRVVARVLRTLSGGHRKGTHSIIGTLLSTAVFAALVVWLPKELAPYATGSIAAAAAVALLGPVIAGYVAAVGVGTAVPGAAGSVVGLAVGVAVGFGLHDNPGSWTALTVAYGIGYLAHLAGDLFTRDGVPLAWPVAGPMRLAYLRTGSFTENMIVVPTLTLAMAVGLLGAYLPVAQRLVA